MPERRKSAEFGSIANKDVEPAVAAEEPRGELVDFGEITQIDRNKSSAAAGRADPVVELFKTAYRPCRQNEMRALSREPFGHRRPDAARSSGNQCNPAGETAAHQLKLA